jgi:hypothetical protein
MNEVQRFVNEFDTRHGDDFVRVNQWLFFADGARRDVNPFGLSMEPPEDELERFQNMEVYRREKLKRALEAFNKLRQEIVLATDTCRINGYEPPCSAADAKKQLEALLTKARFWQRKVKTIEERIANTPRMQSRLAYQEGKAYNRTLCEEVIAAIQGIEI